MPRLSVFFTASMLSSTISHGQALSPEDGSMRIRKWYFSDQNYHYQKNETWLKIENIAREHDLQLIKLQNEYQWAQDLLFFDLKGRFVEPAAYPDGRFDEGAYHGGLTRGIYNEEFGITRSDPTQFLSSRSLKVAFPEGGALISGFFKSGEPYILTDESLLFRAQEFIKKSENLTLSLDEVKIRVAQDFQVKPQHVYALKAKGHLDLEMLALPGGKILVHDPRLNARVLNDLIPRSQGSERKRLESMLDIYTNGWARYYSDKAPPDLRGKPIQDKRLPYHPNDLRLLDAIQEQLSKDFTIVRVAGEFHEMEQKVDFFLKENINFFNAFHGKDAQGRYFQLSNSSRGLPLLEEYWKNLIQKELGDFSASVYFPGLYSGGAGLDCSGAVSVE